MTGSGEKYRPAEMDACSALIINSEALFGTKVSGTELLVVQLEDGLFEVNLCEQTSVAEPGAEVFAVDGGFQPYEAQAVR